MNATSVGIGAVVLCGLLLTAALVWAVRFGTRVRRREQSPGRLPPREPVRQPVDESEHRQTREPNEVPRLPDDAPRPTPHDLGNAPDRPGRHRGRSRW